ncbi:hypothetical protein SAMN02745213_01660 [Succinivibrio dextrinosolvens DSM 3072]|uniref:Cysteine rich repeat-containing protein n=1 Tax=Succinivibrio dextrinosolvens DSM 3072 TaxID=1123324 RepID=A0A1T4VKC3_9GAMM|nr:hypothetical protein [Succinivibrio dextrinosolvens]SKA65420.1 hypothetical protein SAMN02745213_01660 [Succinivibrio dextrinosolvens DSM 3072]
MKKSLLLLSLLSGVVISLSAIALNNDNMGSLQDRCNLGDSRACFKFGSEYRNHVLSHDSISSNTKSHHPVTVQSLEEVCEYQNMHSCIKAASSFSKGHI